MTTGKQPISEYEFWIRVLRMAAAIIGAIAALWLLSGDRNPDAMMQHPEAALGRTADLPPIVPMSGSEYSQIITIGHNDTLDRDGVFFFFLQFPNDGMVVLSADDSLAFSQYLIHHAGRRTQLILRDITTTPPSVGSTKDGTRGQ